MIINTDIERTLCLNPRSFEIYQISLQRIRERNAILVSWIRMVLKPLRPIDTANIIKKTYTPNNQPDKNQCRLRFL